MRALVVDDSRAMRAILRRALCASGYEVTEAKHGLDALDRLEQDERPDLVVVDLHMPELDGMGFVSTVRSNPRYDSVRLLVVSSDGDIQRIEAVLKAGADEYLMKPFDGRAIADKLEILGLKVPAQ